MAYQTNTKKRGRPVSSYKYRSMKYVTPKGYEFHEIERGKIKFRKKNAK